jgi:hypothetical protein
MGKSIHKVTSKILQVNIKMETQSHKNNRLTKIAMGSKELQKKECSMTRDTNLSKKKKEIKSKKPITITT